MEQALRSLGLPRIARLEPPATLDGGDVLCLGWAVLVGLSKRTNQAAVHQLTHLMEELGGPPVFCFQVRGDRTLHFKSVLSALDPETLVVHDGPTGRDLEEQILAVPELAARLRVVRVPDMAASNVLSINEHLVMQVGGACGLTAWERVVVAVVWVARQRAVSLLACGCMRVVLVVWGWWRCGVVDSGLSINEHLVMQVRGAGARCPVGSGCGAGMGYIESLTRIHSGKCHSLPPPGRRRLPEAMG